MIGFLASLVSSELLLVLDVTEWLLSILIFAGSLDSYRDIY